MSMLLRSSVLAVLLSSVLWAASPPALVNFQGVLRDSAGNPRTGSFDMEFQFYSDPDAGDQILLDQHFASGSGAVTAANGLFTAALGSGTLLDGSGPGAYASPADVFRDYAAAYLEIRVGPVGGPLEQLSSRIRVLSSAYALNADHLDGLDAGSFLTAETDPQVGAVGATNWCVGDGAAVQCNRPAPVLAEVDPQVGTLTPGSWCTTNGTVITCSTAPPTDHGGLTGLSDDDHLQYAATTPGFTYRNVITAGNSDVVPLTLRGSSGQATFLQQWQNSATGNLMTLSAAGTLTLNPQNVKGITANLSSSQNVVDITNSGSGIPIYASTTAAGGIINPAIFGLSNGSSGTTNSGIYGSATNSTVGNIGIQGWADGNAGDKFAVYGTAMGSGNNYGGYFSAQDAAGSVNYGVYSVTGTAPINYGGYFQAFYSGVTNTGIYATAAGAATNRAAYFNGDTVVANGKLTTAAPTTSRAGLILPHGTAPSTPADGDVWTTTGGLYARINGVTKGPLQGDGYSLDAVDGNPVDAVYVDAAGNTGVGTTAPGFQLDVNGRLRLRHNATWGTSGLWLDGVTSPTRAFLGMIDNDSVGLWGGGLGSFALRMNVNTGKIAVGAFAAAGMFDVYYDGTNYIQLGYTDPILARYQHDEYSAAGDGQAALSAIRTRPSQNDGTGYTNSQSNQAIKGLAYWGDSYTFGVSGYTYFDFTRTGGVLGGLASGGVWGSLGYRSSGSVDYGGYFTSTGSGAGRSGGAEGIGLGSYGGLMGGWIKGEMYGLYASGSRFGLLTHGNAFTTGYQAFLQEHDGEKSVTYAVASPSVDVMIHGTARLEAGRTTVPFPFGASAVLSGQAPIAVFLSPTGGGAQFTVSRATPEGFEIAQAGGRSAAVEFAWIAIGQRKGFERVEPPAELLAADFGANMERAAFDENDLQGSGLGMYYDDTLRFGVPPGSRGTVDKEAPGPAGPNRPSAAPEAVRAVTAVPVLQASPSEGGPVVRPTVQPVVPPTSLRIPYAAGETVEIGDVLVMSPADERALYKCIRAADPMVVGVAAELSASAAGPPDAVEVPVVLAGIALVKADATLGPIARGDLLVTSPNPGHAMTAVGPIVPGTVVGKAMESLAAGTGLITMLVMAR